MGAWQNARSSSARHLRGSCAAALADSAVIPAQAVAPQASLAVGLRRSTSRSSLRERREELLAHLDVVGSHVRAELKAEAEARRRTEAGKARPDSPPKLTEFGHKRGHMRQLSVAKRGNTLLQN